MQRIVILNGETSRFLPGDADYDNDRFLAEAADGTQVMSVLPILLNEGWTVETIQATGATSAILILNAPEEGQGNQFPGEGEEAEL